jgi:hypothetical protein
VRWQGAVKKHPQTYDWLGQGSRFDFLSGYGGYVVQRFGPHRPQTTTVLVPKLVLGAGLINHIRVRKYRSTIQTLNPTVKGG